MLLTPVAETGPARRLGVAGAAAELLARQIERRPGLVTEAYTTGPPPGQSGRAEAPVRLLAEEGAGEPRSLPLGQLGYDRECPPQAGQ